MKPLIKYRGGKSKEIPHIVAQIPRFSGRRTRFSPSCQVEESHRKAFILLVCRPNYK